LGKILKSDNISYLIHNYIALHNPLPHGWADFIFAQPPLGRFTFSEIKVKQSGKVCSFQSKGLIVPPLPHNNG